MYLFLTSLCHFLLKIIRLVNSTPKIQTNPKGLYSQRHFYTLYVPSTSLYLLHFKKFTDENVRRAVIRVYDFKKSAFNKW